MTPADLLLGLGREMAAVHSLGADHWRRREFLVRRAAAADRLADANGGHPVAAAEVIHEALLYARALLDHDLLNGTGRGPVPPESGTDDPRGYARQEHRVWVLEHETP